MFEICTPRGLPHMLEAPDGNNKRESRRAHVISIQARTSSVRKMASFCDAKQLPHFNVPGSAASQILWKEKRESSLRVSSSLKPISCETLKCRRLPWGAPEVDRH